MSKKPRPAPKAPVHELTYEIEGAPPKLFLVRHVPSGTWWGPNETGYTEALPRAGTYTEAKARELCERRGEEQAVSLADAVREFLADANPAVLQALLALGAR